jgi:hypothetical protein
MNGDSYRLKQSANRHSVAATAARTEQSQGIEESADPDTGEITTS